MLKKIFSILLILIILANTVIGIKTMDSQSVLPLYNSHSKPIVQKPMDGNENFRPYFLNNIFPLIEGPFLISHFIFHGHIHGFSTPHIRLYRHYGYRFGNIIITASYGILPVFIGVSRSPVSVTAVSMKDSSKIISKTFSPFIEILIPAIGFSIQISMLFRGYNKILFEYNLDLCLYGFIFGGK